MCGIIGYTGKEKAIPILIEGLRRLEYRGYDSAGLCVTDNNTAHRVRSVGRIANLENKLALTNLPTEATTGIAHTRWATHGESSEANAHPHCDSTGTIFVVHNGIVENYRKLKENLENEGVKFTSDTDTEVIPNLIAQKIKKNKCSFEEGVSETIKKLEGTFGIVVVSINEPYTLIVARRSSPLIIGVGKSGHFVASDATAIIGHTRDVVYLNDDELAILTPNDFKIKNINKESITRSTEKIDWSASEAEREGFPHFMLKEIFEGPVAIKNSTRGRLIVNDGNVKLGGLEDVSEKLKKIEKLYIVACGTAYHAALVGSLMIEEYAKLPITVMTASEFRYRDIPFKKNEALLAVSQSGETADTLAAVKEAKQKGLLTLGIVNVVGSTIARETDAGVYNHAGSEISVASTKAYLSQLTIFTLLAVHLGRQRSMSLAFGERITNALTELPNQMAKILEQSEKIKTMAEECTKFKHFIFLGRKYNYPTALEGALKLKEISYRFAEAYPAGELKHGPLALIDENVLTIAITLSDSVYEKMVSNLEEVKARSGPILVIATEGDVLIKKIAEYVINVPKTIELLSPILAVIPLHLFAYYTAVALGKDVDHPRNLAKSVTVE